MDVPEPNPWKPWLSRRHLLQSLAGLGAVGSSRNPWAARAHAQQFDQTCLAQASGYPTPTITPAKTRSIFLVASPCLNWTSAELEPIVKLLNTQLQRDFKPIWGIDAEIQIAYDGFPSDAWAIRILAPTFSDPPDCIPLSPMANGTSDVVGTPTPSIESLSGHGWCYHPAGMFIPHAWVYYDDLADWVFAASHECLEMLANPQRDITHQAEAPSCQKGNANYIQEICDPCGRPSSCYVIDEHMVSDFVTPDYFVVGSEARMGAKYNFLNTIVKPLEPVEGGFQNFQMTDTCAWFSGKRTAELCWETTLIILPDAKVEAECKSLTSNGS